MPSLEVICGPMFSGKSEELIRRLRRIQIAKKNVITFKPAIDNRYDGVKIVSHTGASIDSVPISKDETGVKSILENVMKKDKEERIDVVGIDEAQFFHNSIAQVVDDLIDQGKDVIVAGLDKDFRKEPFGPMPILLAKADYVIKLDAVCMKCGEVATTTQRIINGIPAKYDDPVEVVGAQDKYEARCRKCHEVVKE